MRKCEVDGIYERLEREAPTYSEGGHSEASESGTQQRREPDGAIFFVTAPLIFYRKM